jgi:hypothetical protein
LEFQQRFWGKEMDLSGASAQSLVWTEPVLTTMLEDVLPAVFHFMQNGVKDMAMTSSKFLSTYVG